MGTLFTPEGRKAIAKLLASTRSAASTSAMIEGRDAYPEVAYTTDGETIFANRESMTDEAALASLQQMSVLVLGRGF